MGILCDMHNLLSASGTINEKGTAIPHKPNRAGLWHTARRNRGQPEDQFCLDSL